MATLRTLIRNRWRWVVAIIGLAAIAAVTLRRGPHTAREFLARGDDAIRRGHTAAAILDYRNAVRLAPNDVTSHRKLADAYMATDDLRHAYEEYTRITDLAPADLDARVAAGRVLLATGDVAGARDRARDVLARQPTHRSAVLLADITDGRLRIASGDPTGAADEFRQAIRLAPTEAEPHVLLGEVLVAGGDADAGLTELLHALRLAPDDELANRAMGWYYVTTDRRREAEPYFRRAASGAVDRYHSGLALADYLLAERRTDEARHVLEHMTGRDAAAADVRLSALTSRWADMKTTP
ncbi:MAG TPA: tetratricopeptide repeat protein [Vicinamibacterales bacterium]|nr:tetratricopeptide repeat protein [Vicinamibacterales bacterium]